MIRSWYNKNNNARGKYNKLINITKYWWDIQKKMVAPDCISLLHVLSHT